MLITVVSNKFYITYSGMEFSTLTLIIQDKHRTHDLNS